MLRVFPLKLMGPIERGYGISSTYISQVTSLFSFCHTLALICANRSNQHDGLRVTIHTPTVSLYSICDIKLTRGTHFINQEKTVVVAKRRAVARRKLPSHLAVR